MAPIRWLLRGRGGSRDRDKSCGAILRFISTSKLQGHGLRLSPIPHTDSPFLVNHSTDLDPGDPSEPIPRLGWALATFPGLRLAALDHASHCQQKRQQRCIERTLMGH